MIPWQNIQTVLLDMDGTLLDLHFDNHFWMEHLPKRYAESQGISLDAAQQHLFQRFHQASGTLNWYCVDYWSDELDVDIVALKQEVGHLIDYRPQAVDFLKTLQRQHQHVILITNAHQKSLDLKIAKTELDQYVDDVICSHQFNSPKEHQDFWHALQQQHPFDKQHTLFIDDSTNVLQSAKKYGIKYCLSVAQPDSKKAIRDIDEFPAIQGFSDIMPHLL